jgi:PAS domain S-box-containing protein
MTSEDRVSAQSRARDDGDSAVQGETPSGLLEKIFGATEFLVAFLDAEFRFIRVNRAYAQAANRSIESFVGRKHFELYPHDENEQIFQQVLETGQPFTTKARPFEHSDRPERGTTYCDWSLTRVHDEGGRFEGLLLVLVDVTEQRRAEIELERHRSQLEDVVHERTTDLQKANQQLRREVELRKRAEQQISNVAREWVATFDTIPDFVSVHDAQHRIVKANRALSDSLGAEPRDLLGKPCYALIHGVSEPWPECPHRRALETGRVVTQEVSAPKIGIPLLVSCTPLHDTEGRVIGTVHVARDVSAQKRADEERDQLIAKLQESLAKVKVLGGLLPICSSCKRIRDDKGYWNQLEAYVRDHSDADFTHGICPECTEELYPGLLPER